MTCCRHGSCGTTACLHNWLMRVIKNRAILLKWYDASMSVCYACNTILRTGHVCPRWFWCWAVRLCCLTQSNPVSWRTGNQLGQILHQAWLNHLQLIQLRSQRWKADRESIGTCLVLHFLKLKGKLSVTFQNLE